MKFCYGGVTFELPDDWMIEADFPGERKTAKHYPFDSSIFKKAFVVPISSIFSPRANEGTPIFNSREIDGHMVSAKDRTISILRGLCNGNPIAPVKVVNFKTTNNKYKYKLVNGTHRFHCSIAAGYTEIPVVYGIDMKDPDL